jgi:hypothetical protein
VLLIDLSPDSAAVTEGWRSIQTQAIALQAQEPLGQTKNRPAGQFAVVNRDTTLL